MLCVAAFSLGRRVVKCATNLWRQFYWSVLQIIDQQTNQLEKESYQLAKSRQRPISACRIEAGQTGDRRGGGGGG